MATCQTCKCALQSVRENPNPVQTVGFWQSMFSISLRSSNSDMVSFSQLFSPLLGATKTELLVLFLCVSLQKAFVEGGSLPCPLRKYEWPQASRTQILVGWPECSQQWHGMWLSISHQHIAKALCMGMHGRRLWIISSNVFAPFFGCCKSDAARKKYINRTASHEFPVESDVRSFSNEGCGGNRLGRVCGVVFFFFFLFKINIWGTLRELSSSVVSISNTENPQIIRSEGISWLLNTTILNLRSEGAEIWESKQIVCEAAPGIKPSQASHLNKQGEGNQYFCCSLSVCLSSAVLFSPPSPVPLPALKARWWRATLLIRVGAASFFTQFLQSKSSFSSLSPLCSSGRPLKDGM